MRILGGVGILPRVVSDLWKKWKGSAKTNEAGLNLNDKDR